MPDSDDDIPPIPVERSITLPSPTSDPEADIPTPRLCGACGGSSLTQEECRWCDDGYQSYEQQQRWNAFRTRMRKLSASYDFLETTVQHTLAELLEVDEEEVWARGTVLLDQWRSAEAGDEQRSRVAGELQAWMRDAVALLRRR